MIRKRVTQVAVLVITVALTTFFILSNTESHADPLHNNSQVSQGKLSLKIHPTESESSVRQVLVVSYGRSGSTFTSGILAIDAFFFFEPFRLALMRAAKRKQVIHSYQDIGSAVLPPQELAQERLSRYEQLAVHQLDHLLDCDLTVYPVTDFHSDHYLIHGDTAPLAKCLWSMFKNETYLALSRYLTCLLRFHRTCQRAPVRVFKVIRLPLRTLFQLLRRHPNLRVLYLVRDPRAILHSQQGLFGKAPKPADFCQIVVDDARHFQLLETTFGGRVFSVRYEDICQDPLSWTKRLYDAMGLKMTSKVVANVRMMTSVSDTFAYSTLRGDPKAAANKWRQKMDLSSAQRVDRACVDAYSSMGYLPVNTDQQLRDANVSLTSSSPTLNFLTET